MNVVTTREYEKKKIDFLHRHDDWKVETSPMNEYGQYHKTYVCTDGAVWYEVNTPVIENVETEVEVKGVKVTLRADVKLLCTEGWSTDNASIYCYESYR